MKNKYKEDCTTCGGFFDEKYLNTPCPECGRWGGGEKNDPRNEKVETKAETVKIALPSDIPRQYHGIYWSEEILKKDHTEELGEANFERYCKQLDRIHTIFTSGVIPNKSAIITAPPAYSKVTWAYSCMQSAIAHGHSVTWLLDTIEVKRLLVLASENPRYRLYNKIDYDNYILSDVCFITVTKTEYSQEAFKVIQEILDRRSRKGLATFIISRFDLRVMSKRDYLHHAGALVDKQGNQNSLKYPAFITYLKTLF